jgi:hypothetical protein
MTERAMAVGGHSETGLGFSPEDRERVLRAIDARLAGRQGCVLCGHGTLTLVETPMYLSNRPPNSFLSVPNIRVLPCIVLVCDICGNTHLLAMSRLGLADLVPSWLSE